MPSAMDHDRFGSTPGNHWDTKRQCQMLLKDDEAYPDEKSDGKGITICMISEQEGCLKANALTLEVLGYGGCMILQSGKWSTNIHLIF